MKMEFKNILNFLTLIDMILSINGYEQLNSKEENKDVKKRGNEVYKKLRLDPGKAWQSSYLHGSDLYPAGNVVDYTCEKHGFKYDGYTNRHLYVVATKFQQSPAWAIDLQNNYKVAYVEVTVPRKPNFRYFVDVHLFVTDERPNFESINFKNNCSFFKGPPTDYQKVRLDCNSRGRFVMIALKTIEDGRLDRYGDKVIAMCALSIYSVDGKWMDWTSWTKCTKTCGVGQRSRTREYKKTSYGGKDITNTKTDLEECEIKKCSEVLEKQITQHKILFPIIGSIGALLLVAVLVGVLMYRRWERRHSISRAESEYSVLYPE